ncbi:MULTISPECIES: glycerol-3-phosphate dehydrogenase/oxidase [unclassified Curtobacterium]|uniref:glycerol-3-phosphate dehydrogenase/oxidase n=1 Tax=unclassified Curtobacterium TaxID=257496 RepID=UPI0015E8948D|nr:MULTISPECIES: glycerol-3-phosphate dehydrogenase/oxidase [unclassified Curtobacterium]MDY1004680.1 glycerol-3-phosphate dehydrogenase/oxidase [Curtobacterium sp. CFBP9011]WIE60585.1 glycerol-3-phosphate dehydrogenase/oxidase [Curtobacterium sp. MCLR17_032]
MSKKTQPRNTVTALTGRPNAQVLIVGGGINGIATFRDLALQGVDVALVERGDYASGASAASSHMIHGGIRYLENGEFRLVRESVQERNGLIRIAPHYVKPLQTTMPIFSTFSGIMNAPLRMLTHKQRSTKERGAMLIKIGMTIYDSFSRDGGSVPKHVFRTKKAALQDMPALNRDLKYTGTYYDASVHEPERLALDVLKDGLAASTGTGSDATARATNYVEAAGSRDGGVLLRDRETGEEFVFTADVVVNASGPWTDLTNEAFGGETKYMGGTKGSHIVVDNPELLEATKGRELFFENNDGRIVLIYPLKGRVLIGTTDIDADPSEPAVCTEEEVDYFFGLVKHVFPQIELGRDHIVYRYSGIRPLPRHEDTAPGFVSRDYRIVDTPIAGLPKTTVLSLVGGKWTTFRALAAHLSTDITTKLGVTRKVDTTGMPIGGGKDFPTTDGQRALWIKSHRDGLASETVDRLLERYGTRAAEVVDVLVTGPVEPLESDGTITRGEVRYFAEREQAVHLIDVVLRRTNLAFVGGVTIDLLDELADVMAETLGWTTEERADEIQRTLDVLRESHGVIVPLTSASQLA